MSKSSLFFRCCKHSIQVYRTRYKSCHQKIISLDKNLSNANALIPLLANDIEKARWQQWSDQYRRQLRQDLIDEIVARGPDVVMSDIADALEYLHESDPRGSSPANHQIGVNIWQQWDRISKIISTPSRWGIQRQQAMKELAINNCGNPDKLDK